MQAVDDALLFRKKEGARQREENIQREERNVTLTTT